MIKNCNHCGLVFDARGNVNHCSSCRADPVLSRNRKLERDRRWVELNSEKVASYQAKYWDENKVRITEKRNDSS
jgi:hypothetical protein